MLVNENKNEHFITKQQQGVRDFGRMDAKQGF